MRRFSMGSVPSQRGITGLETAIILIAFVVVASVFAFTVLSTGIFASERSKETVFSGIKEAQSSIEPRGSVIAYRGVLSDSTATVFKLTMVLSNAIAGEPVDLTPPYTSDSSGVDPDVASSNEYVTVVSYSDKNQYLSDVPWTVSYPGNDDADSLLEDNEKAEISIWLLDRNNGTAIGTAGSVALSSGGGISATSTVLTTNDEFTVEIKPAQGAVLNVQRTLPSQLDTVMDLN
jgi:flagellin FlaB